MKRFAFRYPRTQGFSLVELMVAMTIGLIILAAVSSLFVNSKKTYTTQDNMARLQENGRFAMQFLMKDLRLAGYYGCISDISADTVNNTVAGGSAFDNNTLVFLEGMNNASGTWYPSSTMPATPAGMVAGTDAVAIRMADPDTSQNVTAQMASFTSSIAVADTSNYKNNDTAIVSDCSRADVAQVTVTSATALTPTASLNKQYGPPIYPSTVNGTHVMKYMTRRYFVRTNASGNPALYRLDSSAGSAVELVEGIENLQILYGKDTDNDKVPNVYLAAGANGLQTPQDWASVVSIRIGILARTVSNKETDLDNTSYDIDGTGQNNFTPNPPDRYKRKVFQAVVFLRNAQ